MTPENILVVEDDGLIALDIRAHLISMGFTEVRMAASAASALAEIDAWQPDLALLDVNISGDVDGIELGAELRSQREIPVVYITGSSDPQTVERASRTLPNGYLRKPIEWENLRLMVQIALEEGKVERERRNAMLAERESERQLMRLRQMEAVATLTSGLAHELNNSLQVTLGNIALAETSSATDPTTLVFLNKASDSCTRSAKLIQQLLAFAQRGIIWPESSSLLTEIEDALKSLRFELHENIQVEVLPETADHQVWFDRAQLRTTIASIIMNAQDAMAGGGVISLSISESSVDAPQSQNVRAVRGRYITLRIADRGHGIEEQDLGRIFEPFFTSRSLFERKGLGLSVAHGMMQRHGGWITVSSKKGVGTTVELWFPADHPDAVETSEPA